MMIKAGPETHPGFLPTSPVARRAAMRAILRAVAASHGLTEADIYVRDRSGPLVRARQAGFFALDAAGFALAEIAALGGWDDATVRHGIEAEAKARKGAA